MRRIFCCLMALAAAIHAPAVSAQSTLGTPNVRLVARHAVGGTAGTVLLEQRLDRPYAYVLRPADVAVIDLGDPEAPRVAATIPTPAPVGAMSQVVTPGGTPMLAVGQSDGVAWFDVSDPTHPSAAGHTPLADVAALFAYHGSDGSRMVFAAAGDRVLRLDPERPDYVAVVTGLPEGARGKVRAIHDVFAIYDLETMQDRLYTAGTGGYGVYDVTDADSTGLITFVQPGTIELGRGVQATPDGTHLVTTAAYRTAPLRLFDLRPALSGDVSAVRTDVGAWTANWRNGAADFELRWPYLLVAAGPDGFHMVNVRNPFEPYTTATWRTWDGPGDAPGAVSIDVRDADGLVAVSDERTGLWLLRVDDFRGWDGRGWGVPDLSAAQRWDRLPSESDRW